MGAWNYSFLDNDPALDIKELWDEMLSHGSKYDHNSVTERCFSRWGEAVEYGDTITNMEILALVVLHLNSNIAPSPKLRQIGIDAINRELVPCQLESWKEPEKRRKVLLDLLIKLGGEAKPPKVPTFFKDNNALQYENANLARIELLKIIGEANGLPWITYMIKKQMADSKTPQIPPFIKTLDRLMNHHIWEKDQKIYFQAITERLRMLTTYLGIWLKMPRKEIEELLNQCEVFRD